MWPVAISTALAGLTAGDTLDPVVESGIAIADVDQDGDWDAVIPGQVTSVYLQGPAGVFTPAPTHTLAGHGVTSPIRGTYLADLDCDGLVDLYLVTVARLDVFFGDGTNTAVSVTDRNYEAGGVADFDHDGLLDVFAGTTNDHYVFLNSGLDCGADFTESTAFSSPAGAADFAALGDFDDDGWTDVALRNTTTDAGLFLHDGTPTVGFTPADPHPDPLYGTNQKGAIAFCDAVPGGDLEIVNVERSLNADGLAIWERQQGSWTERFAPGQALSQMHTVACADLANDGSLDVWVGTPSADRVIDDQDAATFTDIRSGGGAAGISYGATPADLDDDGDLDVVVGRSVTSRIYDNDVAPAARAFQLAIVREDTECDAPRTDFGAQAVVAGLRNELSGGTNRGVTGFPVLHWGAVSGTVDVSWRSGDGDVQATVEIDTDALSAPWRVTVSNRDRDGDGLSSGQEGSSDDDGDGRPADEDRDADGDGTPDAEEVGLLPAPCDALPDLDGDTIPDHADADTDGDGATDLEEGACGTSPVDPADACEPDTDDPNPPVPPPPPDETGDTGPTTPDTDDPEVGIPPPQQTTGCSCDSGAVSGAWLLVLLGTLVARRD